MKNIFALLLTFISFTLTAQNFMVPGDTTLETKWMKNESYQMKWYVISGAERHEVARINSRIVVGKSQLSIITSVDVNNAKTTWIDSTITKLPSFAPVRHYSDNLERAVSLKFGTSVTGSYLDKLKKQKITINSAVAQGQYFDSNFYPYLIRLLPLKDGYTQNIATYDYSVAKSGAIMAQIKEVKSGTYKSKQGSRAVWIVTSIETIKGQVSQVDYFIDKADRRIWKQEIFDGIQHTLIERVE